MKQEWLVTGSFLGIGQTLSERRDVQSPVRAEAAVIPVAESSGGLNVPAGDADHGNVNAMEDIAPDEFLFVHTAFVSVIVRILARGLDHE